MPKTLEDIRSESRKHKTPDGYTWWIEEKDGQYVGHLHEKHGPLAKYAHPSRPRVEQTILGLMKYHRTV